MWQERVPGSFVGSQIPACPSGSQAKQKHDCHSQAERSGCGARTGLLPGRKGFPGGERAGNGGTGVGTGQGKGLGSSRAVRGCCSQPLSAVGGGTRGSADCTPASPRCGTAWHGMERHSMEWHSMAWHSCPWHGTAAQRHPRSPSPAVSGRAVIKRPFPPRSHLSSWSLLNLSQGIPSIRLRDHSQEKSTKPKAELWGSPHWHQTPLFTPQHPPPSISPSPARSEEALGISKT